MPAINCALIALQTALEAELFVNGRSLGKKSMSGFPDHIIYWDIDYEAGSIKAIGYNSGEQVAGDSLVTTGTAYALNAKVEKDTIGKTNLTQVIINITDNNGHPVYNAEDEITISLTGNAVLLGLESGSNTSHEDYKSNKRKALHGRLIAYVQVNNNAKNAEAVISSPGLQSKKVKL